MSLTFPLHANPDSGARRRGRAGPGRSRLRRPLHRPHGRGDLDQATAAGTTDEIKPYGPFLIDPATAVLHYAQEVFEGLKAYRHADGSIHLFRPEAERPPLPDLRRPADAAASCRSRTSSPPSRSWSRPTPAGCPRPAGERSLYLRPFLFASEVFLGVRAAQRVTFCVIASPGRPLLHRRGQAGRHLGHRRPTPAPASAAPARPSAAATTPRP